MSPLWTALACTCLLLASPAAAQVTFAAGSEEAAAPGPSPAVSAVTLQLPIFSRIQVCTPFNIVVAPNASYSISAVAESQVLGAISATVRNGTLDIETTKSFETQAPIKVQVFLPSNAFERLVVSSPLTEVSVAPGFSAPNFTLVSTFSSGSISVLGFNVDNLLIQTSGTGQTVFNGTIANATVLASGTGSVFLLGTNTSVTVDLAGVSNVWLRNTRSNVTITGSVSGINRINFNLGICKLPSVFIGLSACQKVLSIPVPSINPQWSCGLNVSGNFTCRASNAAAGVAAALAPEVEAAAPALADVTPVSPATVAAPPSGQSVAGVPLVVTGVKSAVANGAPGQPATAIASNTGAGTPPGSPVTSSAESVTKNAPASSSAESVSTSGPASASANSASTGRRLHQVFNTGSGSIFSVAENEPAIACAAGTGPQNAFSSSTGSSSASASSVATSGTGSGTSCTPIASTVPEGTAGTAESFTGTDFITASSLGNGSGVSGVTSGVCEAPASSLQIFQSGSVAALNG